MEGYETIVGTFADLVDPLNRTKHLRFIEIQFYQIKQQTNKMHQIYFGW